MSKEEIVTIEEQEILNNWVTENQKKFTLNPLNYGYYTHINTINENFKNSTHIEDLIYAIKNRIIEKEKLHGYEMPKTLHDFVYYMDSGTKLHFHRDPNDEGTYHIRFNVILKIPDEGGIPIYGGKKKEMNERCYIICRSGMDFHTSSVIKGDTPKILISFGFSIPTDKVHLYSNR
jgi:hypothetical protein